MEDMMKHFLSCLATTVALICATATAKADIVVWNFGLDNAGLLGPAGSFNTFVGKDGSFTSSGQEAVFQNDVGPAGFFVGANGFTSGGAAGTVTQRHPASSNTDETGIGVCDGSCSGETSEISTTEWLRIALNNPNTGATDHPGWTLQSIVFTTAQSGEQAEFWLSDDGDGADAAAGLNQHDDMVLPSGGTACDAQPFGAATCQFNFANINDPALNDYDYLWIRASAADILLAQLSGVDAPVPEPATLLLFGAGLLGVVMVRRKSRKA